MTVRDLIHWDRPFGVSVRRKDGIGKTFATLQDEVNRLFDRFTNGMEVYLTDWEAKAPSMPAVNVLEKDKFFKIEVDLAGISPENVDVEATDGFLTIKGEQKEECEEKENNYLRREISFGSFQRTVALPESADCRKAEALFKNGVLTLNVPKKAGALENPKKLTIRKAA